MPMRMTKAASQIHQVSPSTVSTYSSYDPVVVGMISIILFLMVNPFLALFLLSLLAMRCRVPTLSFIIPASISFALFFYSREFGIDWYPGSSDDVPTYIYMYNINQGVSVSELFVRFFDSPSGNEPLWHLTWWVLKNGLDATGNTFVFLHYLVIFLMLFLALYSLSSRYLVPFALVYFFLIPISVDGVAHIWRQQLASFIFLAGAGLYLVRGQKIGKLFIYISPLFHLSGLFFVSTFLLFVWLRKLRVFGSRFKMLFIIALILVICPIVLPVAVKFLDLIGLQRIQTYFLGSGVDQIRVYLVLGVYGSVLLAAFFLLRNDDVNRLFLIMCLSVFGLVLMFPGANGIYDRLLMVTLPLLALFLFRCIMLNFHVIWRIQFITLVFFVGLIRLYAPTVSGYGPGSYLAFGHAFDPFMGLFKMLIILH
jgi:hypothetical protein